MAVIDGLIKVNFLSHLSDAQVVSNTFHIVNPGAGAPPDETELLNVATEAAAQFATSYKSLHVVSSFWDVVVCKQVSDGLAADVLLEATYAVAAAGTRTETGSYIPNGICGVASIKTPNASRRFRGHLMLPPCRTAGSVDGNVLNSSNAYTTAANAFIADLNDGTVGGGGWSGASLGDYNLCIFSRTAALASDPPVANAQTVILRPKASFLRRRERGAT
jgi:hypothetical protein